MSKSKLLWIGDSPTVATGFGNVSMNVLENLKEEWEVFCMGVNGNGDPHDYTYKIYPASTAHNSSDIYGLRRVVPLINGIEPDVLCILNDPWIVSEYLVKVRDEFPDLPIVCYIPIDAENQKAKHINMLNFANHIIAYTEFGRQEMLRSGLSIPCSVIPHGVDTSIFHPVYKSLARKELDIDEDLFLVLNVNRNSPRKRIDLFLYFFAEWLKKYPHDNARIYYHGAVKDIGIDVLQYASFLGIDDRLFITDPALHPATGINKEYLKFLYGMADVYFTPCAVEGWGLTVHEAMACGIPCIIPEYSALAEWPNGGVFYVPVDDIPVVQTNGLNTVHKTPIKHWSIEALEAMYQDEKLRKDVAARGYKVATQEKYNWRNIAEQFNRIFKAEIEKKKNRKETTVDSGVTTAAD